MPGQEVRWEGLHSQGCILKARACRTEEGTQREAAEAGAAEGAGWGNSSGCVCPASVCAPRACRGQQRNTREISGPGDTGRDEKRKPARVSFRVLSVTSPPSDRIPPSVHLCAPLHPLSLGGCSGSLSRSQGLWFHPAFSLAAPTTVHAQASDSPGQEMRKGRVCDRLHSLRSQAVLAGPSSGPVMTALVGNCMHLLVMGNRGEMTPVCSSHTLLHSIYYVCRL